MATKQQTRARASLALLLALAGCGGQSSRIDDSGSDSGSDADADADADVDRDAGEDADGTAPGFWAWTPIDAPLPTSFVGDYSVLRIWAVADDDIVLCSHNYDMEVGGLARFDGETYIVETEEILCTDVWGAPDGQVLAFGEDPGTGDDVVFARNGTSWAREEVDGADGCSFEAFYATPDGMATLSATCAGRRMPFTRIGTSWAVSARWIAQPDRLTRVRGGYAEGSEVVFYGEGVAEGDGLVTAGAELGYPEATSFWAVENERVGVVAVGLHRLWASSGAAWVEVAACPDVLPHDLSPCWDDGVELGASGVLLGGGCGSGDVSSQDRRLHFWDGARLRRVLEPCGGTSPYCGVDDLSATPARVWAAVRQEWQMSLLWATRP